MVTLSLRVIPMTATPGAGKCCVLFLLGAFFIQEWRDPRLKVVQFIEG